VVQRPGFFRRWRSLVSVSCHLLRSAQGFLTGKIDENTKFDPTDFRNIVPRFSPGVRKANMVLVELVKSVAECKGATPAQVVLAWLLAQKP
jgi:aryl-alcohol dehydrogenase-like predicted oxidoreductase